MTLEMDGGFLRIYGETTVYAVAYGLSRLAQISSWVHVFDLFYTPDITIQHLVFASQYQS